MGVQAQNRLVVLESQVGYRDGYGCGTCSTMPLAVSYVMEAFSLSWAESSSTWGKMETTEAGKETGENDRQRDVLEIARWRRGRGAGECGRM